MNIINPDSTWESFNGQKVLVNDDGKILAPSSLKHMSFEDLEQLPPAEVNYEKLQLIAALIVANTRGYIRLQSYLENLANVISLGNEFVLEQEYFDKFHNFICSYQPIDVKMGEFLRSYADKNASLIGQLQKLIGLTANDVVRKPKDDFAEYQKQKVTIKKNGLFRYPFLHGDKLVINDVENFKTIKQIWNPDGLHQKLWKNVNEIPFLINGYDDDYLAVNRLLASQIGKLLGLQCEEIFIGDFLGKIVTLTAFQDAITLLENQSFELYELASNYTYQSHQKRIFYQLIQHWAAYALVDNHLVERFDLHYVDSSGNVFLSRHEKAAFVKSHQLPNHLSIMMSVNEENYRPIKDLLVRVGDMDVAAVACTSLPTEYVEIHDEIAYTTNRPSLSDKQLNLKHNWEEIKNSVEQFERGGV